jgi:AcrR family transcriptional regulator
MSFQTAAKRRSQQRADARRAILDAAEALLAEGDYESFSIRRLADRCGYTAPSIYHHFGDKLGLLDALLEERFADLLRLIRRVPVAADPLETIRARARAFVRFGLRNPTHYRILTSHRGASPRPLASAEQARGLLEQPWRQLIEQGRLAAGHIDLAQHSFFALLHGIISLRNSRPDLEWPPAIAEESVDALLRGWIAPAAAPPPGADHRRGTS